MLINKLSLCDVGLFRGRVDFDLRPNRTASRSVVLIGGLNGTGKTTILTAIRLAFYGKLAVGTNTSMKAYDAFIDELIHNNPQSLVRPNSASVTIEFEHSQLGVCSTYTVCRSWTRAAGIRETLSLTKAGEPLDQDYEQIQALLNQLVPIGIADLFFFDGERISSLATDDRSPVLADSVKKLMGLQLVERLQTDLSTYLRQNRTPGRSGKADQEFARAESQRADAQEAAARSEQYIAELTGEVARLEKDLILAESELSLIGGAWAKDREQVRTEKAQLEGKKAALKENMRELLDGEAVFSLLGPEAKRVEHELQTSVESARKKHTRGFLIEHRKSLQSAFRRRGVTVSASVIQDAVDEMFTELATADPSKEPHLQEFLGESEAARLLDIFGIRAAKHSQEIAKLCSELSNINVRLNAIESRLEQSPEESLLSTPLRRISELNGQLIELKAKRLSEIREVKSKYWLCFESTREIRRLEEEITARDGSLSSANRIEAVQVVLEEFASALKKDKLKELATSLERSFKRLSRKSGLISKVEFDQESFAITIKDGAGREIPKKKMSAGEQQIFAISVLDALLTSSRRSLPLVIDTPLGRLDSVHREILVRDYLPTAAHQVVVLSTDTEVDARFYESLAPFIARAYHLTFDEREGATTVRPGYFWKETGHLQHAA